MSIACSCTVTFLVLGVVCFKGLLRLYEAEVLVGGALLIILVSFLGLERELRPDVDESKLNQELLVSFFGHVKPSFKKGGLPLSGTQTLPCKLPQVLNSHC